MSLAIRIVPETLRSLAFGSITTDYAAVGGPLLNPSRILLFQNGTDAEVFFSWDGVNDHMIVPTLETIELPIAAARTVSGQAYVAQGTTFYVRYAVGAPTGGSVFVASFYGSAGSN